MLFLAAFFELNSLVLRVIHQKSPVKCFKRPLKQLLTPVLINIDEISKFIQIFHYELTLSLFLMFIRCLIIEI